MRFFLLGFGLVLGLAAGQSVPEVKPQPALFTSAQDFFALHPRQTGKAVRAFDMPRFIWKDQKELWTSPLHFKKGDLKWVLPLAGTAALLMATDRHTEGLIHSDNAVRACSSNVANFGLATFAAASAASFGMGVITHDEHARETGILTAEALADSFLVSEALKLATQRARPLADAGQGQFWQQASLNSSFPSEHAALAWSAAAVIAREYPGPVTQWSAYGLASLISFARITGKDHFPSDVLVGAVAGYLIGRHIYSAHHNDGITDETGATPLVHSPHIHRHDEPPEGSVYIPAVYIPVDSWIYPALRRIAALGYIPDQVSDLAPWTRAECVHQVEEASESAARIRSLDSQSSLNDYVLTLLTDLKEEFSHEPAEQNAVRLESIYTRMMDIQGSPLRDSYHFGQTVVNDYGRPYGAGLNNITGASGYAQSGRFSVYVRGEYQEAPGAAAYPLPVREFIASADRNPLQGPSPIASTSRFEALEMYAGVQLGFEDITFGKQSLWWGPSEESAFSFSNNAAPFYMLRMAQARPLVLPGLLSHLGKIRTEIVFGKLSGHQWPPRPFVNAQKISLDLTDNLEIGFTRSAFFGGVGHPLTFGSLGSSLFSVSSVDVGPYGSSDPPGDRHSDFDFRWRVPGLRRYLTIYSDSYADDDPNPIDNPRRSAWSPGLYISHLPGLNRLDFTFETDSTLLYRKDYGGDFVYYDSQYHDSYTNNGVLLGSWIGRDARAYLAAASYWFSAKSKLQGQYKQIKAGTSFLPGGGTQTDVSLSGQWTPRPEWMISGEVQVERYFVPVLGGAQMNVMSSLQLTFTPRNWMRQR